MLPSADNQANPDKPQIPINPWSAIDKTKGLSIVQQEMTTADKPLFLPPLLDILLIK
jgi:hypothetical protein